MLRFPQNSNTTIGIDDTAIVWKRRPSEIRGYMRTLYFTTNDGDYLRVDYNLRESKVRLYVEDNSEGGIEYYSIINNGKITIERNLTTGRTSNLSPKFEKFSEFFATIPNRQVLKLIGNNYGIFNVNINEKKKLRDSDLEKTRRKYFVVDNKKNPSVIGQFTSDKRLRFSDIVDLIIGASIAISIFYLSNNYMFAGIVIAIYGIILGIVDMFLRKREPIFLKIMIFVFIGFTAYIYGYYFF